MDCTSEPLPPCLQELVDAGLSSVPSAYIRPPHERFIPPSHDLSSNAAQIPVIDISALSSSQHRHLILQRIREACTDWGFFQVINHGVPHDVMIEMRASCSRFFQQPPEMRNIYRSQSFDDPLAYSTSFNPAKEKANDWKDVLYVRDFPGNPVDGFGIAPDVCRGAFQVFRYEVARLAKQLYEAIFEGLGLSSICIEKTLPGIPWLAMCVNYYPRCPDPSITYGSTAHTDGGSLTILLQDDVAGLWIQKKNEWVQVKPLANSFVVNIGDQVEILSNGIYKSIKHTVLTNSERPRMSVACIFGLKEDENIAPIEDLVSEHQPARYKEVRFGDYLANVYNVELAKLV